MLPFKDQRLIFVRWPELLQTFQAITPQIRKFSIACKIPTIFIYSVHANIRLLEHAFFSSLSVRKGLHRFFFLFYRHFFANEQESAKTVSAIFWNTLCRSCFVKLKEM